MHYLFIFDFFDQSSGRTEVLLAYDDQHLPTYFRGMCVTFGDGTS